MGMKAHPNILDASKTEVGEIDTRVPFESVKAAVSLFGASAFTPYKASVKKPKQQQSEIALVKETELHVAQKELNRLKDQLKNCETTRVQALEELEKAKQTVEELTSKLRVINESRESAVNATEAAKLQIKQLEAVRSTEHIGTDGPWNHELEDVRDQYAVAINELNVAKQELHRIRQEFEASMDAKVSALEKEADEKMSTGSHGERAAELSKDIATTLESTVHVKSASVQAKLEESKIVFEKDKIRQQHKLALEETEKKLAALKEEFDPNVAANLEAKLIETNAQIGAFQKEMQAAKTSDLDSVATVTTELDGAKGVLQKFVEEEAALRKLEELLKSELENIKKEHSALKEREAETETIANDLNIKLQKSKAELEATTAGEAKARASCDDLLSTLQQLTLESENARKDMELMKTHVEELRKEAEATKVALKESENKLQVALKDTEEAKAAEADALNQIKLLSERTNAARSSTSESGAKITISTEELESLSRKVEESEKLAEMKVAAAMAQVEAIKASENEAVKKLEASHKEMHEMESATADALKRAEMAEAARRAVEGEMRRWREREQKKTAEAASRMLAEAAAAKEPPPPPKVPATKALTPEKAGGTRKAMDRTPTMKKVLMPTLSSMFHKKKSHADSGSPSYLPGENPV